jgi:hypothetical protein
MRVISGLFQRFSSDCSDFKTQYLPDFDEVFKDADADPVGSILQNAKDSCLSAGAQAEDILLEGINRDLGKVSELFEQLSLPVTLTSEFTPASNLPAVLNVRVSKKSNVVLSYDVESLPEGGFYVRTRAGKDGMKVSDEGALDTIEQTRLELVDALYDAAGGRNWKAPAVLAAMGLVMQ